MYEDAHLEMDYEDRHAFDEAPEDAEYDEEEASYQIIRMYRDFPERNRTIVSGLSLDEAQRWCREPNTSSSTATSREARERTDRWGPWFDGYEEE